MFVDWSQNDEHKTTISVYSLRARERPTVSTPVKWDEVEQALKKERRRPCWCLKQSQALDRVQKVGDLFEPVLTLKQKLPKLTGIAEAAPRAGLDLAAQAEDPGTKKAKKKNMKPARRRSVPKPKGRKV